MKKMNFTTIQSSWCLGTSWLRGIIPLIALLALMLPMQTQAQSYPNCSNFSPAINGVGDAEIGPQDFLTNSLNVIYPVTVTVYNQWGGTLPTFPRTFITPFDVQTWDVCGLLGQRLQFSVQNVDGKCNLGWVDLNGTPGAVLTTQLGSGKYSTPEYSKGKMVVYCGQSTATPAPTASAPCGGTVSAVRAQPDWVMMPDNMTCGIQDTAEVIWRTWEVFDSHGQLTTLVDTIVVIRLPQLATSAFVTAHSTTEYCQLGIVPNLSSNVRWNAWKQTTGIHDYELPYSKLGAVIYELPRHLVKQACEKAAECNGVSVYKEQVILKKANPIKIGNKNVTDITIGHIISDEYWNALSKGGWDNWPSTKHAKNDVDTACGQIYHPYLFLEVGDQVVSESGSYVTVTEDWFYNGHGNSPFWFSGGWPYTCDDKGCIRFCDYDLDEEEACITVRVPQLVANGYTVPNWTVFPYDLQNCVEICLTEGTHCGIIIDRGDISHTGDACDGWTGGHIKVTQTCWGRVSSNWGCSGTPDNGVTVERYDNGGDNRWVPQTLLGAILGWITGWPHLYDKQVFDIYQKVYHKDNIPPIFDFCYKTDLGKEWDCAREAAFYTIPEGTQAQCAKDEEYNNPTIYSTGTYDCAAEVFVPDVVLIDNCSGIHSVKATIVGTNRMVALELNGTQRATIPVVDIYGDPVKDKDGNVIMKECVKYTYSHLTNPIRVPFNGCEADPIEVIYEAADNCWNQSTWSKFIRIVDRVAPVAVANTNINVTVSDGWSCVKAIDYDEGSWDNCGIDLYLARRCDWIEAYIDICAGLDKLMAATKRNRPTNWNEILWFVNDANLPALLRFAGEGLGEIGAYYASQVENLMWNKGDNGDKAVNGWRYDIAQYIAANCSAADNLGNKVDPQSLSTEWSTRNGGGTGNEMAALGGGWVECVPFVCQDACESICTELLVMDYCQNWNQGWTETHVRDLSQARVVKNLPTLNISCEAYNVFYKDIADAAAAFNNAGGSAADTTGAYADIDAAWGTFVLTDASGRNINDTEAGYSFSNVSCSEVSETVMVDNWDHDGNRYQTPQVLWTSVLDTTEVNGGNGQIAVNCSGSIRQDIWIDLDACGQGQIIRRFFITGGCDGRGDKVTEIHQYINVASACAMKESMFNVPGQVGTKDEPVCLSEALTTNNIPASIGELTVKGHLIGQLCNSIATGADEVASRKWVDPNYPGLIQYEITWTAVDWCCANDSPDRKISWQQKVMAIIDPACASEGGDDGDDSEGSSLVRGTIATEKGDAVQRVEMKAVLGSGSPMTTVTGGDGAYSFSMNNGWDVSLIPSKNTGFANGVTTQDLIEIQRHVLQKKTIDSKYARIAADINGNGSIDAFDVQELRKLVLQPDNYQFANNTSWRFFDKNTSKEVFDVTNLNGDLTVDFVGVKIGDVNLSGDAARSSRSLAGALHLNVADKALKAGETYRVDVTSDNFADITGFQYTLNYLSSQVEIESIEAGALNISKDNYLKYAAGMITSSWSEADGQSLAADQVLFTIVLKAKSSVQLRDVLSLNDRVTRTEAYDGEDQLKDISLRFDGQDSGFALYQNTPNPYAGQTTIGFKLPEASKATLSVYDVTGKLLKVVEGEYGQGYNEVQLKGSDLNATGVLYYQLDTKTYTATKKMIVIE